MKRHVLFAASNPLVCKTQSIDLNSVVEVFFSAIINRIEITTDKMVPHNGLESNMKLKAIPTEAEADKAI
jgi:5'(3')-deoxyribonucleotidase